MSKEISEEQLKRLRSIASSGGRAAAVNKENVRNRAIKAKKTFKEKRDREFHDKYMPVTESGCWIWLNRLDKNGYGSVRNGGKYPEKAHRVSYMIHKGEVPEGLCILHKCNIPCCINPDHLYAGTPKDNYRDLINSGYVPVPPPPMKGEKNPWYGKNPRIWDSFSKEERSEIAKKRWEGVPKEERSRRIKKSWETRRGKNG